MKGGSLLFDFLETWLCRSSMNSFSSSISPSLLRLFVSECRSSSSSSRPISVRTWDICIACFSMTFLSFNSLERLFIDAALERLSKGGDKSNVERIVTFPAESLTESLPPLLTSTTSPSLCFKIKDGKKIFYFTKSFIFEISLTYNFQTELRCPIQQIL